MSQGKDAPARLHAKTVAFQDKMKEDQVNLAPARAKPLEEEVPRAPNVMDEQFPTASLGAKDPRDEVQMAKLQLQEGSQTGYTPFGKLIAKDSDFEWYQKKAAAAEAANFQQWFAKNFDMMSPAQKKRAKELYPEFYKQRKKLVKQQAKNLIRFANLKLQGPETFDDLYLQYLAESGRLDLGPLQNLLHPEQAAIHVGGGEYRALNEAEKANLTQRKFQRGLLSPFRVFGAEAVPALSTWNAEESRAVESSIFANRDVPLQTFEAGYTGGFPPMGNANVNQSDAQWWQRLKMQV